MNNANKTYMANKWKLVDAQDLVYTQISKSVYSSRDCLKNDMTVYMRIFNIAYDYEKKLSTLPETKTSDIGKSKISV